jgi:hypothetical protein
MADYVVYGIPGSPYVRAVLLMLEEKGAPWTLTRLKPDETRGPEHLARQPFGTARSNSTRRRRSCAISTASPLGRRSRPPTRVRRRG